MNLHKNITKAKIPNKNKQRHKGAKQRIINCPHNTSVSNYCKSQHNQKNYYNPKNSGKLMFDFPNRYRFCGFPIGVNMLPRFAAIVCITTIQTRCLFSMPSPICLSVTMVKGTKVMSATSLVINIDRKKHRPTSIIVIMDCAKQSSCQQFKKAKFPQPRHNCHHAKQNCQCTKVYISQILSIRWHKQHG